MIKNERLIQKLTNNIGTIISKRMQNIRFDCCVQTVNHTIPFVDPTTGVHTQHIESYWNKHKQRIKRMNAVRRELLVGYLNEFMWIEKYKNPKFINFSKLFRHKCKH